MFQNRKKSFEFGHTLLWFVLVYVALEIQTLPSVLKIMPESILHVTHFSAFSVQNYARKSHEFKRDLTAEFVAK